MIRWVQTPLIQARGNCRSQTRRGLAAASAYFTADQLKLAPPDVPPPRLRNLVLLETPRTLEQNREGIAHAVLAKQMTPAQALDITREELLKSQRTPEEIEERSQAWRDIGRIEPVLSAKLSGVGFTVNPESEQEWEIARRKLPALWEWQVRPADEPAIVIPEHRALRLQIFTQADLGTWC